MACALSALTKKDLDKAIKYCSRLRFNAIEILNKTSSKNVESAPWIVSLPTSSLSNIAKTLIAELSFVSIKARVAK